MLSGELKVQQPSFIIFLCSQDYYIYHVYNVYIYAALFPIYDMNIFPCYLKLFFILSYGLNIAYLTFALLLDI